MVMASPSMARQIVARLAEVPNACCSSANVRSDCSVIKASNRGRSGVKMGVRHRVCFRGAIAPVSRRRCFKASTQARLT